MFFGFIAALINTVVFMFMHDFLHTVLVIDNTIAFIVSNLASFWFNHKAVFTKNVDHEHKLWQKLLSFFAYRIISLLPDTLIMWLGMELSCLASLDRQGHRPDPGRHLQLPDHQISLREAGKEPEEAAGEENKKAVKLSFTAFLFVQVGQSRKVGWLEAFFAGKIPGNII